MRRAFFSLSTALSPLLFLPTEAKAGKVIMWWMELTGGDVSTWAHWQSQDLLLWLLQMIGA